MSISATILPEFDQEIANLRKALARVPDDKFDWKPHPRSNTMGWLANHLANLPSWATFTIKEDVLNLTGEYKEPQGSNTAEVLAIFDKNLAEGRKLIEGATDEQLMAMWKLLFNGKEVMSMPRLAVIRGMIMNHMIHHRAQLTVYFRLNDVPVPALYGPSADEGSF